MIDAEKSKRLIQISLLRSIELAEQSPPASAGIEHLESLHKQMFAEIADVRAGEYRPHTTDSGNWTKNRVLNSGQRYSIDYLASNDLRGEIERTLAVFHVTGGVRNLSQPAAAEKLSVLYGDLDYQHPFYDGNTRTLRVLTNQLAGEAGFVMAWPSHKDDQARANLYLARDREVIKRHYPDLTRDKAASTDDRREYEAYVMALGSRAMQAAPQLRELFEKGLTHRDRTAIFEKLPSSRAKALHPELASAYQILNASELQAKSLGMESTRTEAAMKIMASKIGESLAAGKVPRLSEQGARNYERTRNKLARVEAAVTKTDSQPDTPAVPPKIPNQDQER